MQYESSAYAKHLNMKGNFMTHKPDDISQDNWDAVDSPPVPEEMMMRMKPAKSRGPQKRPTKEQITLRLSPVALEHFRNGGQGWQSRINDALEDIVKRS